MLAAQVSKTAVKRQTAYAGSRNDATWCGESEQLGLAVDVGPGRSALGTDGPRGRINADGSHARQVDDDPAIVDGVAGDVVAASADREEQPSVAREVDGLDDIGHAGAADDQARSPVDQAVADRASLVVPGIAGLEHRAAHPRPKVPDGGRVDGANGHRLAVQNVD